MIRLILRDYQKAAVDAAWNYLGEDDGNPIVVLPTGTGKALCIAEFVRRALEGYPDTRILVLTHSTELVAQNYAEMKGLWPECPAGIYAAGLNKREINAQVIFGSIQSIHKKSYELQRCDLILVDEAQSIPRNANAMWRKFINELTQINKFLRVVGWTATAFRLDSGMLHKGDDALFSSICYEYNVREAIEAGYLCPPVTTSSETQIDTSGVGTRGGEFIAGDLEAAAMDAEVINAIADEIVALGKDRRGWIVFGCGVKHCTLLRDAIRKRGFSCEGIFATTPLAERAEAIDRFRRMEIRCLVSVNALAVGFNAKHTDLVALAVATKSAGKYIQAVGRGLRLFPGKADAMIADFGGNVARFGCIDAISPPREKGKPGDGETPTKQCPECEARNPLTALECVECGAPFPAPKSKVETKAAQLAILSSQIKPVWLDVSAVTYQRHEKAGKPPSMRVLYRCGMIFHQTWWCPEHTGFARQKFVQTWLRHAPGSTIPKTVEEALSQTGMLAKPKSICVRASGKYTEIVSARFE